MKEGRTARREGESNDGNVFCIRLFISCHLAHFPFWGGESREGGGAYGQKLLTSFHLSRVYFRHADYQQCLDRRLAVRGWFHCAVDTWATPQHASSRGCCDGSGCRPRSNLGLITTSSPPPAPTTLPVPGPQGFLPWIVFTVCNAHGGGGDEEKPQEAAAGAMDGVLGPGF